MLFSQVWHSFQNRVCVGLWSPCEFQWRIRIIGYMNDKPIIIIRYHILLIIKSTWGRHFKQNAKFIPRHSFVMNVASSSHCLIYDPHFREVGSSSVVCYYCNHGHFEWRIQYAKTLHKMLLKASFFLSFYIKMFAWESDIRYRNITQSRCIYQRYKISWVLPTDLW